MAFFPSPRPRYINPPFGPEAALLAGLSAALVFNEPSGGAWDCVGGQYVPGGSTAKRTPTQFGLAPLFDGTVNAAYTGKAGYAPISTSGPATGSGDFTVLVVANIPPSASTQGGLFEQSGGGTGGIGAYTNTSGAAFTTTSGSMIFDCFTASDSLVTAASVIDGADHCYGFRRAGTNQSIWQDGVSKISSTVTVRNFKSSGDVLLIGSTGIPVPAQAGTVIYLVLVWNRALTDIEMQQAGSDPWGAVFMEPTYQPVLLSAFATVVNFLKASFGFTGNPETVNASTFVTLAKTAFSFTANAFTPSQLLTILKGAFGFTGRALTVNAGMLVTLGKAAFSFTGQSINANLGKLVSLLAGSYGYTGKPLTLTETLTLLAGAFGHTGRPFTSGVSPGIVLLKGAFSFTGRTVAATVLNTITLGKAAFSFTGRAFTAAFALVIALLRASFSFTGRTVGILQLSKFFRGIIKSLLRGVVDPA